MGLEPVGSGAAASYNDLAGQGEIGTNDTISGRNLLGSLAKRARERSQVAPDLMPLDEYFDRALQAPQKTFRSVARYTLDAARYFGTTPLSPREGGASIQYKFLRDQRFLGGMPDVDGIYGQDKAIERFFAQLRRIDGQAKSSQYFAFHGPAGTGKTLLMRALTNLLIEYSKTDDGALYRIGFSFDAPGRHAKVRGFAETVSDSRPFDTPGKFVIPSGAQCDPFAILDRDQRVILADRLKLEQMGIPIGLLVDPKLDPTSQSILDILLERYSGDLEAVLKNHVVAQRYEIAWGEGIGELFPVLSEETTARDEPYERHGQPDFLPEELVGARDRIRRLSGPPADAARGHLIIGDMFRGGRSVYEYEGLRGIVEGGLADVGIAGSRAAVLELPVNTLVRVAVNDAELAKARDTRGARSLTALQISIPAAGITDNLEEAAAHRPSLLTRLGQNGRIDRHALELFSLFVTASRLIVSRSLDVRSSAVLNEALEKLTPLAKAIALQPSKSRAEHLGLVDTSQEGMVLEADEIDALLRELPRIRNEFDPYIVGLSGPLYDGGFGIQTREAKGLLSRLVGSLSDGSEFTLIDVIEFLDKCVETEFEIGSDIESALESVDGAEQIEIGDPADMLQDLISFGKRLVVKDIQGALNLTDQAEVSQRLTRYLYHVGNYVTEGQVQVPVNYRLNAHVGGDFHEPFLREIEEILNIRETSKDEHRARIWNEFTAALSNEPPNESEPQLRIAAAINGKFVPIREAIEGKQREQGFAILRDFISDVERYRSNPDLLEDHLSNIGNPLFARATRYNQGISALTELGYSETSIPRLVGYFGFS
ncbi:MAG: hypothetical protein KDD53_06880, partial [Bdellovibrionales bacterium]|nr:hypothetical protein [Bdellovibrionales bacterium]